MAEAIGIASGIAGLATLAMQISQLSYTYFVDIKSARQTQREYLNEITELTSVLLQSDQIVRDLEDKGILLGPTVTLSEAAVKDCRRQLEHLKTQLEHAQQTNRLLWPIKEISLRKQIENLHRLKSIFTDFKTTQVLTLTSAALGGVRRLGNRQDQVELLEWIGNPKRTSNPLPTPLEGTGAWLLESEAYKQWADGSGPSLHWYRGPPGVGKSNLAAVVLNDLASRLRSAFVLQYFCDFGSRKVQTKDAIWKDLLSQLIADGRASVLQALIYFREELGLHRPLSSADLSDALKSISGSHEVVLVIDGFDEIERSTDPKAIMAPFIKAGCRIMIFSRDIPSIRGAVGVVASVVELQASMDDLRAYIVYRFSESHFDEHLERHPGLQEEILDKSQGIFLLARLLTDTLLEQSTVKEMRDVLKDFPNQLDLAFESSFQRIDSQSKSHRALAHRAMGWVVSAQRKLQMSELIHGLATEEGVEILDEENLHPPKTILKVCGGLLVLQGDAVSVVHGTVYALLRKHYERRYHDDLAESCLRYLTMPTFRSGIAQTVADMDNRLMGFPFLSYAAQNWRKHLVNETEIKFQGAIDCLLDDPGLRSATLQASQYRSFQSPLVRTAALESIPGCHSALHVASYWNLARKVAKLLTSGADLNAKDTQMWTPLHWACFGRSKDAVEILLSHDADPNAKDSVGWTPLFWAALHGDTEVIEALLRSGANHTERDRHEWTALRWAVSNGQLNAAKTLLEHHSKTLSSLRDNSPLRLKNLSFEEASHFLSYTSVKSDMIDELKGNSTSNSDERSDYDEILSLFEGNTLNYGSLWESGRFDPPVGNAWRTLNKAERIRGFDYYIPESNDTDQENKTTSSWKAGLLQSAIRDGKLIAVRLLLETGANVNPQHRTVQTPLHTAAFRRDSRFAELLVKHGACLEALNQHGFTPLQQAVVNGFEETARLLLQSGADINAMHDASTMDSIRVTRDSHASKTPLMLACGLRSGDGDPDLPVRMVRMLLEHGADVSKKEMAQTGMTTLHCAARSRNLSILRLVLDSGADPETLDDTGRSAFHHFVLGRKSGDFDEGVRECMDLLSQRCSPQLINQTAKWPEFFKQSEGSFVQMESIHTPLSLSIVLEQWEDFETLRDMGAIFETNVPLEQCLVDSFNQLNDSAVDLLVQHGARFPSNRRFRDTYFFRMRQDINITPNDLPRFQKILEIVIPLGYNINATDWDKRTLLHKAAECRSGELAQCLLDHGADPYLEDNDGIDSIILCCMSRNLEVLQTLLSHIKDGMQAAHWTQSLRHPQVLDESDLISSVAYALGHSGRVNRKSGKGTLLSLATRKGSHDLVIALLANGADTDIGDIEGQRPLHAAAEAGHAFIARSLVESGALVDATDQHNRTPLHFAAYGGHLALVELLLSKNAHTDMTDHHGWQPLHFAAWKGHADAARLLLGQGASAVAATSNSMWSWGTSPNGLRDGRGSYAWTGTPLHLAAMCGNAEIARLILQDNRVDVNARADLNKNVSEGDNYYVHTCAFGLTALHIALHTGRHNERIGSALDQGRLEIAAMLVERGANVEGVANHLGWEDVAKFKNFPDLWDKLRVGIRNADEDER